MTTLFDDYIDVHYGFISLGIPFEETDGESVDIRESRAGQANGLLGAAQPGCLSMVTGLHTGEVALRVEWLSDEPPVADGWDDVVEASVEFRSVSVELASFETFIEISIPQAGWHRARFCAVAMDEGHLLDCPDEGETAPDRYLLQLWPAPASPDRVIREDSEIARYWHSVARGETN